ncbi:hypothetical protein MMC17_006471 [Xylographa soralifera]|nr:hypothetical protein [Xylographa soralifera]
MCPVEPVDRCVSRFAETLVSAIAGVRKVMTTHRDVIWKTNAQELLQGQAHHWKLNLPLEDANRRVYYEDQDMLQLGDESPSYSTSKQPWAIADTFAGFLSQYRLTVESYWHHEGQIRGGKRFFRIIHRGSLSNQLRKFLPCELQYTKVSLCPCGSSRGEEICTVHNEFVRWPVFGISPADRARLSGDLKTASARPKRKPVSRIAKLRALGVPMLSHEYIHPSVDLEENSYTALRGLTIDEMEALLERDVKGHICKIVLGISENNLIRGCAIDFLVAFLLSLTENIERIKPNSEPLGHGTESGPMYVVPLFQDLAKIIVKSGLVDSTDEALTIVVSVFATGGLLPATPDPPSWGV